MMLVVMAALVESEDVPSWPLGDAGTADRQHLRDFAERVGLDESGYRRLLIAALELTASAAYQRPHVAICALLAWTPTIDAGLFAQLQMSAERTGHHGP